MKRVAIVLVLLSVFAAIDVLVRVYGPSRDEPALPTATSKKVVVPEKEEQAPVQNSSGAQQPDPSPIPKPKTGENVRPSVSENDCKTMTKRLVAKHGKGLSREDVAVMESETDPQVRPTWFYLTEEYLACKAVELRNYELCRSWHEWFPRGQSFMDCETYYKLLVPMKSVFVLHQSAEEFASGASQAGEPEGLKAWMKEFHSVMTKEDPEGCARLADDPRLSDLCRFTTGRISSPPNDPNLREGYFMAIALRSGKDAFLEQMKQENLKAFVKAIYGIENACETNFISVTNKLCEER